MEFLERPEGASQSDLALLSREYSVFLPQDLRTFLSTSDGPILWFGFKELQFLSVSEILQDEYGVRAQMPNALPLCFDGMSNICVAEIQGNQIVGYYVASCGNLGWDESVRISATFADFLTDDLSPEQRVNA